MKKVISLLLTISVLLSFSACTTKKTDGKPSTKASNATENEVANELEDTGIKVSSDLCSGSIFSGGLALVAVSGESDKTYCINKNGNIVFEHNEKLPIPIAAPSFKNGVYMIGNGIEKSHLCNSKGEITHPEDVGVTKFYEIALEGGYIIAEKTTSDYATTKKELGVMDFDFNWIVSPSETLYNAVENSLHSSIAEYSNSYYYNDYMYYYEDDCYVNLKTGDISYESPFKIPSKAWFPYSDFTYRDSHDNIILDLSSHKNINRLFSFCYKKAVVEFYNAESDTYYFTLIDESGDFLFEPVSLGNKPILDAQFDGKDTILLTYGRSLSPDGAKCYSTSGKLIGETEGVYGKSNSYRISEGILLHVVAYSQYSRKVYYYNTDFTPLF